MCPLFYGKKLNGLFDQPNTNWINTPVGRLSSTDPGLSVLYSAISLSKVATNNEAQAVRPGGRIPLK